MSEENRRSYQLYVEVDSNLHKGKKFWTPVGQQEHSIEEALTWLKADFNIWKQYPNANYHVKETIHWKPDISIVKEGTR